VNNMAELDAVVSRAAAQAYQLFPGVKEQLPPEDLAGHGIGEFLTALGEIDPAYPTRMFLEGNPQQWFGLNQPADYTELDAATTDAPPTPDAP
jgi:hypothetical protein